MSRLKHDFGLIFWIHLLLILLYIATPFLITWYWILVLVIIFVLQDKVFKRCLLTSAQLESRGDVSSDELSFYAYYFKKMGLKVNARWVKKYFAWTLLWTVVGFSLIWQILFSKDPIWF